MMSLSPVFALRTPVTTRVGLALLGAASLALGAAACDSSTGGGAIEEMPEVSVSDCSGATVDLKAWAAQTQCAVISVGAGWCGACKKEVPQFNTLFVDGYAADEAAVTQLLVEDNAGGVTTDTLCADWTSDLGADFAILHDPDGAFVEAVMGGTVGSQLPLQLVVVDGEIVERSFTATPQDLKDLCDAYQP